MDDFYNTAEYKEKYGLRPMEEIANDLTQIAEEFKSKETNSTDSKI